jgi:hypothetical protein
MQTCKICLQTEVCKYAGNCLKEIDKEQELPTNIGSCPFCGGGITFEYNKWGTTLYCDGCQGEFTFPAYINEVKEMLKRKKH